MICIYNWITWSTATFWYGARFGFGDAEKASGLGLGHNISSLSSLPVPRFVATIWALFRFVACTVQLTPWKQFERASQCNSLSGFHMFSEMKYLRYFGQQCDLFPKLGLRLQVHHKALEMASNGQSWTIAVEDSGGPTVEFTSTLLGTWYWKVLE